MAALTDSNMEVTVKNYSYIFNFEREFRLDETRAWMRKNWTYSFYYAALYVLMIFGGQYYMRSRRKYELRRLLVVWNTSLACFSTMGACRSAPELLHILTNYGLYHSVCVPSYLQQDKVSGFWAWMFVLSKMPELGDTVFIVLRKQPLIFLHWYHHITVLLYGWFSYTEGNSSGRWFIVMNYSVHSVMYSYYALKSIGIRPPKYIQMTITSLQILQMIIGCFINTCALIFVTSAGKSSSGGRPHTCHVSYANIISSSVMYFSYFVLFSSFFYKNYINKGRRAEEDSSNHKLSRNSFTADGQKTKAE